MDIGLGDTVRVRGTCVIETEKMGFNGTPPVPELTERQREILLSMSRGLTDADIAVQLALTHSGIREHVSAIYAKLGAANRAEAVAIALKKHLLDP